MPQWPDDFEDEEAEDFKPWPTVVALLIGWFIALIAMFRFIIPGLIMMQNDAALGLAFMLPVMFGYASYRLYRIITEIIE